MRCNMHDFACRSSLQGNKYTHRADYLIKGNAMTDNRGTNHGRNIRLQKSYHKIPGMSSNIPGSNLFVLQFFGCFFELLLFLTVFGGFPQKRVDGGGQGHTQKHAPITQYQYDSYSEYLHS